MCYGFLEEAVNPTPNLAPPVQAVPGSLPLRSLLVASGPGVEENGLEPGPELRFPDPSLIGWTKNSQHRPCGFDTLAGAVGNQTCSEELRLGLLPRIGALLGTMKPPI